MTREEYGKAYEKGYLYTVKFLIKKGAKLEEAEDCAQTAWANCWKNIHQLREIRFFQTWVIRAAERFLILYRRKPAYRFEVQEKSDIVQYPWENLDHKLELDQILKKCSNKDRACLISQLQQWTTEEVALAEGVSLITIRVRRMRARKAAREVNRKIEAGELK